MLRRSRPSQIFRVPHRSKMLWEFPLSGPMIEVFATVPQFALAKKLTTELIEVIGRITEQPGGAVFRQHMTRHREAGKERMEYADLRSLYQRLVQAEPYCAVCSYCELTIPGFRNPVCRACQGRGWVTKPAFESAPEEHRRRVTALARQSA